MAVPKDYRRRAALQQKKLHERRTQGHEALPPKPRGGSGLSEAEVVPADKLGQVLKLWINRWLAERDPDRERSTDRYYTGNGQGFAGKTPDVMGATQYLSLWTGIDQRQISAITNGERKFVTLKNAEKLLMAIDREYMLSNGEIPVVPNPCWSAETYMAYRRERGCA
jgi:hypothetical protein